jgi:tetratricopeptide (TPR) repeat protein
MAEVLERNGFYQRAAALLRRVLVIFPRHPRCRSFLGDCEVKAGNLDVARKLLEEQISIFPHDSEAYSRMAELLAQKGDTEDAIGLYKQARAVDPADSSSLFNIGLCYLDLENFAEARAYFQRHLGENPDDPVSLLEIANTYYAQGELEMSIRGYRGVLAVKPDHHDCRAWLAATLVEAGRHMEAVGEYELLIKETGKIGFHYNISFIYLTLSERLTAEEPVESVRLRRLADLHSQLETGVRREFIDQFYASNRPVLQVRDSIQQQVSAARLNVRSCLLVREDALPFGVIWSPAVHHLCSRLARRQVFVVLLLCRRAEKRIGYAFPKEIKHMIIREMLAPPSPDFVRSVVPPRVAVQLFDTRETVCFRPAPGAEALAQAKQAGVNVVHSALLYWPLRDTPSFPPGSSPYPVEVIPEGENAADYEGALYLTFPSVEEAGRFAEVPLLMSCSALKCSPAELVHVPYVSCNLSRSDVAPYEGAVGLFCHTFRNRQMCEAALALAGEGDDLISLNVAVSYYLGDEQGVKRAIHALMMQGHKMAGWPTYNAALVAFLLLVRLSPDGAVEGEEDVRQRWRKQFASRSEYSVMVMEAARLLLEWRPCGEAMFRLGVMLLELGRSLGEGSDQEEVLDKAARLLTIMAERSPKHPYVLCVLGQVMELQKRPAEDRLKVWEACADRNPWLGHMEAAQLLSELDRMTEAFQHLEKQVAVDPLRGYGAYAHLLFRRVLRLKPTGKHLKRMVDDVKRFYEVQSLLRETLPFSDDDLAADQWREFTEWEAAQQAPPPANQNRVEFVPRVEETPFGISDDFEQEFLK